MLTLCHAPRSRSTRVVQLIHALGAEKDVEITLTDVARVDGSGRVDPANPHPEGKVPLLVHDGVAIRETGAIMTHLTTLFPDAGLAPPVGTPQHGAFLSWMAWYGYVLEPVLVLDVAKIDHPVLTSTFRGVPEAMRVIETALADRDHLLGADYTAADMLIASPFNWFRHLVPDEGPIPDWLARCNAHPSLAAAGALDDRLLSQAA
ncbi:glutathione S-transferase family protein [Tropicibacter alexandrii]|uniref:glutathione S-transferase family protein n=1 Tax=Tropicibacter alexandrii TaxID=2267683 RepID=UPI000EF46591|nr:glutathione S-transferase family protein [Tropicibacter alexandrii]